MSQTAAGELDTAPYISLATYRKNGAAVQTPVWFARYGAHYYVFSTGSAGKVKRLRNSSRSRIAVCDVRGGSLGKWIDTHSYLVDDPVETERAYAALRERYGWKMRLTNFFARMTGRMAKRALIRIELHDTQ